MNTRYICQSRYIVELRGEFYKKNIKTVFIIIFFCKLKNTWNLFLFKSVQISSTKVNSKNFENFHIQFIFYEMSEIIKNAIRTLKVFYVCHRTIQFFFEIYKTFRGHSINLSK